MKLNEFFGNVNHSDVTGRDKNPHILNKEEEKTMSDQCFWYIIDHDDLHKEHFMPLAKGIKKTHQTDQSSGKHDWKIWMPMVKKGCMEFYKESELDKDPRDIFTKDFCSDICKRLVDHYHNDIVRDEYQLGH